MTAAVLLDRTGTGAAAFLTARAEDPVMTIRIGAREGLSPAARVRLDVSTAATSLTARDAATNRFASTECAGRVETPDPVIRIRISAGRDGSVVAEAARRVKTALREIPVNNFARNQ